MRDHAPWVESEPLGQFRMPAFVQSPGDFPFSSLQIGLAAIFGGPFLALRSTPTVLSDSLLKAPPLGKNDWGTSGGGPASASAASNASILRRSSPSPRRPCPGTPHAPGDHRSPPHRGKIPRRGLSGLAGIKSQRYTCRPVAPSHHQARSVDVTGQRAGTFWKQSAGGGRGSWKLQLGQRQVAGGWPDFSGLVVWYR